MRKTDTVESVIFQQDGRMPSVGSAVKVKIETDNAIRQVDGVIESHAGDRFVVKFNEPIVYVSGQNVTLVPEPEPEIEVLARELRLPSHYQIGERVFVNGFGYVHIVGIHFTEKKVSYDVVDATSEVRRDIDSADVEPHAPPEATLA